jgi:hypothetical protein
MTSARHPLLTDLVALVTFDGRVYPNEAKPLERLGADYSPRPIENALEQWFSFATGKHTWVSVKGATIQGLISARRRARASAWEVEVLINATDDESVALSLFGRMAAGVARLGAERVFLRLGAASSLRDVARAAGFFCYADETLYRRPANAPAPASGQLLLRSRAKSDSLGIYQLYNRVAPANVRAIEGATFREWQAAAEKWGGRSTELVAEDSGIISGWVRAMPGGVSRLAALSESGHYDDLLAAGLAVTQDRDTYCLAPAYLPELESALERLEVEPAGFYTSMARRLRKPVGEAAVETVSEPLPVS